MTRADFDALFSELTNIAQVLSPTATHVRRELGKLLADVVRLENAANRMVRTLRQLRPTHTTADDGIAADLRHGSDGVAVASTGVCMADDVPTAALTELGRSYELAVQLRKASADVQENALAMERAFWRCLSSMRKIAAPDSVTPNGCAERRRDR